jgi:branched-chain amino acid transport system substrate-binding protein
MVLVDAMKRANSVDPVKYLPEVGKTSYDGVTGKIEFDEKGDIKNGAITVFEIKDGKLATLKSEGGTAAAANKHLRRLPHRLLQRPAEAKK